MGYLDDDTFRELHPGWFDGSVRITSIATLELVAHIRRQREWSERTFGPGSRLEGVTDHIGKELLEVRESGGALAEWIDVVILALDGAWRSGAEPEEIAAALLAKQMKNEGRKWPDWRTAEPGKAIEHDRTAEEPPSGGCRWRQGVTPYWNTTCGDFTLKGPNQSFCGYCGKCIEIVAVEARP